MTRLQLRFRRAIERVGDPLTVAGQARVGIVASLSHEEAQTYLSDAELGAALKPIRAAYVPSDDPTASGATVQWNGQSLSVLRAVELRATAQTVARLLILA